MREYAVRFLPDASDDINRIVGYVAGELHNPKAARSLAEGFVSGAHSLSEMPYRHSPIESVGALKEEYRSLAVGNYRLYYWISEEPEPVVTVARVLYKRQDLFKNL